MNNKKEKLLPFSLTLFVIALDQITKMLVVKAAAPGSVIADVFGNDLLCIWHVRNKVIAFSIGSSVPEFLRPFVFIVIPLAVLVFLAYYYLKCSDFTKLQRWAIAGIIGGGIGNLIDRIFRSSGVVDFISIKFFGLLPQSAQDWIQRIGINGFSRWPTFNLADASVVVCVVIWLISIFAAPNSINEKTKGTEK
ncbi:MAG: signal peptidase II [Termitinemataceae bacterium]|nr:MAG: signal peptidase II [Termitinemataceae bacterium]